MRQKRVQDRRGIGADASDVDQKVPLAQHAAALNLDESPNLVIVRPGRRCDNVQASRQLAKPLDHLMREGG